MLSQLRFVFPPLGPGDKERDRGAEVKGFEPREGNFFQCQQDQKVRHF